MQLIVIALVAYGYLPRMSKIAMQQYSGDFVEAPGILLARSVVNGIICMMNVFVGTLCVHPWHLAHKNYLEI